ncbi:AMP-binding protein [Rugamonas rubra]|uniref:Acyl-coenzyme A synthetase/AMP-(Fatty) acid ligase n=1 Tax=Rugamonas rubra TaxID=758825 RepID=A0A1I4MPT8_9BURK|nr:AMP-binding protein [Rugamonas rubra]SFM05248.1 Acyl-coenzyme A synthetase/AMP-(fatty) acid ligase [Rugamonas rubra]
MSENLYRLAARQAARGVDALVGWRAGRPLDNAHFMARARAWRALLQGRAGRNFALYLEDSVEFGAALLGAWQAGKTVWLSADTLEASCAALRRQVDGFLGEFPAALAPLAPLPESAANGAGADNAAAAAAAAADAGPGPGTAAASADNFYAGADRLDEPAAAPWPALAADFPALVVFTSGSTGAAQAIPKKLSQLASEVATLETLFGAAADGSAVLATVSHQHIYGLLFKVLWPLSVGRPIHALSLAYPEQLAVALAAGPCVLVASPAHLKRLPEQLDWSGAARALRAVFSSGGPLPLETAQASGRLLGRVPVEVYGSSETGGIAWRQRRAGSDESWLAFPSVAWRLAAGDNLLEVRSAHLADDDWLTLADRVANVDHAGQNRLLLLGRSDRIVKIEEKRVSLDAMEAALVATGMAREARVVLCDPLAGERQKLAAFVVPTAAGQALLAGAGKQALNTRLRAALAGVVEAVALPRRWRYLDAMPINAQGKTTLAALLALLDEASAPGAAADAAVAAVAPPAPRLPHLRELERDVDSTPPRVLLALTAPSNLLYFAGHFDQAPILPGVVQVEWAIHFGRRYFTLPVRFKGINALKFQHVIRPDREVQLELVHDRQKNCLQFRYLSDEGQHASGRVMFEAEEGGV